jgi:uroporphyrin-III C-methyltransferase
MNETQNGKVFFIGAGPGDPELLTQKAHRLLQSADIVLHDDFVPAAIVALANPQAILFNVGKRAGAKKITQAEIHRLLIDSARRGMNVVRLKSGDPGIFGRLAEEIEALDAMETPFEVIPGVTAGLAAAASLGVALTDRRASSRLVIVSGHHADQSAAEVDPDWARLAGEDASLLIYMPGKDYQRLSRELIAADFPADLPCVAVSNASTPRQSEIRCTLADFPRHAPLESPAILLIGRVFAHTLKQSKTRRLNEILNHAISESTLGTSSERRLDR